jgi:glycerophosphoryl diester phosphodiesterase
MQRFSLRAFQITGNSLRIRRPWPLVRKSSLAFLAVSLLMNLANFSSTMAQNKSAVRKPGQRTALTAIKKPLLVAHRGASGYAPEHTLAAYQLAIEQGADFVEQDLHITKDGVLLCLHDPELSRTTNVKEIFPDRATLRDTTGEGTPKKGWYVVDFTLAEIKKLNAGVWFYKLNPFADRYKYSLAAQAFPSSALEDKIPTLQETIKFVNNRAGLYIEMKNSEFYKALGFDLAEKLSAVLKANGYANAKKSKRIFIQSFSKENLLRMREVAPLYPRVQLLPMEDLKRKDTAKVTPELAKEIAEYAQGVGPAKAMITSAKEVETFHAAGLVIHPYTFRGPTTAVLRKPLDEKMGDGSAVRQNIIADIQRFLAFGIDGGFTDYPALWKEAYRLYRAR